MAKQNQKMTKAARCKADIAAKLFTLASSSYTASAARSIIDIAGWLLQEYRTEKELVDKLAFIIDQVLPPYFEELAKKSQAIQKHIKRKK